MITQELIDFIKNQLSVGKTKEEIVQMLQSSNWSPADIAEGFSSIPPSPQPITTSVVSTAPASGVKAEPEVPVSKIVKLSQNVYASSAVFVLSLALLFFQDFAFSNQIYIVAGVSIVSVPIFWGLSKGFKLQNATFPSALFLMGTTSLISSLGGFLKMIPFLPFILGVVSFFSIFVFYKHIYKTGWGRTIWLVILSSIASGVIIMGGFAIFGQQLMKKTGNVDDAVARTLGSPTSDSPKAVAVDPQKLKNAQAMFPENFLAIYTSSIKSILHVSVSDATKVNKDLTIPGGAVIIYTTNDTVSKILAEYTKALEDKGFEVDSRPTDKVEQQGIAGHIKYGEKLSTEFLNNISEIGIIVTNLSDNERQVYLWMWLKEPAVK